MPSDLSSNLYNTYQTSTDQERLNRLTEISSYLGESPDPIKASELWPEKGLIHALGEEYEEAITSYDKALEIKSDDHQAWYIRGHALVNLCRYEEAITSYDKVLEFNPDDDWFWYNRGFVLGSLGRYEEAITSYDKALEIKPDQNEAWYNKSCIYALQGKIDLALETLEKAK